MTEPMRNIALWALGCFPANILLDVMILVWITSAKPTFYGLLLAVKHVVVKRIPDPYKFSNIYFSILLSWLAAIVALLGIIIITIYRHANNSDTQQ